MLRILVLVSTLLIGSSAFAGNCKAVTNNGDEHYDIIAITSSLQTAQAACDGYTNCTAFCSNSGFRCKGTPAGNVEVVDVFFGKTRAEVAFNCASANVECDIVCGTHKTKSNGSSNEVGGGHR